MEVVADSKAREAASFDDFVEELDQGAHRPERVQAGNEADALLTRMRRIGRMSLQRNAGRFIPAY